MPKRIARWNRARDVWETDTTGLLCEHSDAFSETWPTSGMTRAGTAYGLPTWAPHTDDSASSSSPALPTPLVSDSGGPTNAAVTTRNSPQLRSVGLLLPTPVTQPDTGNGHARNLGKEVKVFKTPTAQLGIMGGSQHPDKRRAGGHGPTLSDEVEHLLPTPSVADAMGGHATRSGARSDELLLPGVAVAAATGRLDGGRTPMRLPDGSEFLGDQLPIPLNPDHEAGSD